MNDPFDSNRFGEQSSTFQFHSPAARPVQPQQRKERKWIPWLLFGLTVLTTLWAGAAQQGVNIFAHPLNFRYGIAFSFTLLLILGVHEAGHYYLCKVHGIPATPPYFIPMPNLLGTMGAFIKIKGVISSRRALLDIGMAGPLAGFVLALPATIIGYTLSKPVPIFHSEGLTLGNSGLTLLLEKIIFPGLPDGFTIILHPVGFAGYIGLLVTAINLLPVGQLDGGHIASALFGRRQWDIGKLFLFFLVPMGFLWTGWWFWLTLLLVFGYKHPVLQHDARSLGSIRRKLAWTAIIIFFLTFVPIPFQFNMP